MTVKINLSRAICFDPIRKMLLPITVGQPRVSDHSLTASGSSQVSSLVAADGEVWEITPDVDIVAAFGTGTPDAAGATVRFLIAGIPRTFGVLVSGEKIAIKTA